MHQPLYSVIIPVYNSEKTLKEVSERVIEQFKSTSAPVELVLINDGSKDKSWEIIKQLKSQYPEQVIGVNLARNFGQHKALLCGFNHCTGDYIITIDDDLQHYPEDIKCLIDQQAQTQADLIYGIYKKKKHSFFRNVGSNALTMIFRSFANTPAQGSSFRLLTRYVIDKVKDHDSPFIFLDEVLAWHSRGNSFADIRHDDRTEGRSGYNIFKLTAYTLQIIVTYTVLPLRLITWFGLIAFFVCLGFICFFIYQKYTCGAELGFTALIVSVIMSTGLILFSIGIIGEYISRLFVLQSRRPPFIIKEILK
jgi:undecaprenyl-phosphate 4-deoxy-4-formamido-L-arabinose transferase